MEFIKAILLGIVEGITEFLPVSSTGHLILVNEFVRLEPAAFANAFNVMIQLGAIFSVVVLYFHKLNPFAFSREHNPALPANFSGMNLQSKLYYAVKYRIPETMQLWKLVIIGVLPAVVLGFLFDDIIDAYLFRPSVVAAMLFFWGLVILIIETVYKNKPAKLDSVHAFSWKTALIIGFFQCLAMVPGTSRSAATIIGAMLIGSSRTAAAEFSFFLAIPTMLGATLLKILKNGLRFTATQWGIVLTGAIVSFLVAMLVIRAFMGFIKKHDFRPFGVYRIVLAALVLLFLVV
ncbi:MAG: undecaprenyl-diphosphate phosphatase [Tissierellia bacterium]|jgi:undecaprenyl-diphosphatase|nr:undecaprenyl-diphosphate phosphatase [Bacillota bacterium]NLK58293.1 undecaprenyl-diphosphate phosphatase [Tissierellia bacterium]